MEQSSRMMAQQRQGADANTCRHLPEKGPGGSMGWDSSMLAVQTSMTHNPAAAASVQGVSMLYYRPLCPHDFEAMKVCQQRLISDPAVVSDMAETLVMCMAVQQALKLAHATDSVSPQHAGSC